MEVNRIYNENNLVTLARMPDEFIDMTVTSPPYDDLRTYNGYQWGFERMVQELFRVTKHGRTVVWVVGDATIKGSETGTSFKQALYFKEVGFNLHDTMIYEKACVSFPETTRYYPIFEYMFIFTKGEIAVFNPLRDRRNLWAGQKVHSTMRNSDGSLQPKACIGNVTQDYGVRYNIWRIPHNLPGRADHPATFPLALATDHILSWSNEGDLVYDPFIGSGTTAKAAHQLGRRWMGSEISAEYVELANKRLAPHLAQENLFR